MIRLLARAYVPYDECAMTVCCEPPIDVWNNKNAEHGAHSAVYSDSLAYYVRTHSRDFACVVEYLIRA